MSTQITLKYCGMEGTGATVKLAKQDAARKIEAVLYGYYTPYLMRHGEMIGIIWREPSGYCHKILHAECKTGTFSGMSCHTNRTESEVRCDLARHMAQLTGTYAGLEHSLTEYDRRNLDCYFAWQENYKRARNAGHDDNAARDLANQGTRCV